ncbi:hypothetical protein CR513_08440, partial [Mucuna pruriens]
MGKKLDMMLVVTALVMLVMLEAQPAECAFGIPLNPCTLPVCTAKCKNILHQKFMSASCTITSRGSSSNV